MGGTPGINFLIADTVVTNNQVGISISFAGGIVDHVIVKQNTDGFIIGHGGVTVVDTIVTDNSGNGFLNDSSLVLARSTVTGNGRGVNSGPLAATSFGDNHIFGNGTDVVGTLTNVGTR